MSLAEAMLLDPSPFECWVAARTDGIMGSGSIDDPWKGSTAALFDSRMTALSSLNAPVTVHLGTGIFYTQGYADGVGGGWQAISGMRIVGFDDFDNQEGSRGGKVGNAILPL